MEALGFWGRITISLRSEAQHPQGKPKARGICAPTPKTPDSDVVPIPVPAEPLKALRCIKHRVSRKFYHRKNLQYIQSQSIPHAVSGRI